MLVIVLTMALLHPGRMTRTETKIETEEGHGAELQTSCERAVPAVAEPFMSSAIIF